MKITPERLREALEASWSKETSSLPVEWSEMAKSRGQCVPTALVVQHYLGGDLQKLVTIFNEQRESHYRNVLGDGTVLDMTRSQYPEDQKLTVVDVELENFDSIREKRLGDNDTFFRYEILLLRVEESLKTTIS